MPIARLCLISLALSSCVANKIAEPASIKVSPNAELDECTELVRALLLQSVDGESAAAVAAVRAKAENKICTQRAEAAESKAKKNEWWAKFGLPIGVGGTAVVLGSVMAILMGLVK